MKKIGMVVLLCLMVVMSGCSSKDDAPKDVKLKDVMTTLINTADYELPATMEVDDSILSSLYQISVEDVEQYAIALPMVNVQATEIIMVEAKEGKLETVKAALNARMSSVEESWAQYLPEQLELVKNRKTIEKGNYVIIIIADHAEEIAKAVEASF